MLLLERCSESGEKLPLKKRKLYHQWEAKAEDKNIAVEEKNITVQVAMENEPEVAEENAIDVNDKDGIVVVKMAATEMLDVDWQGNNIINCVVNYESVPPSPPFYSPQRQEKQEQITFDEKIVDWSSREGEGKGSREIISQLMTTGLFSKYPHPNIHKLFYAF